MNTEGTLLLWLKQVRSQNFLVSGTISLEKACHLATQHGGTATLNAPWIDRFKIRNNIHFERIHEENNSADHKSAEDWTRSILPAIASKTNTDCIYNADGTGLFYKVLPSSRLTQKRRENFGSKMAREILTIVLIVNRTGTDTQKFGTMKNGNPRCCKYKNVPVPYFYNKKA